MWHNYGILPFNHSTIVCCLVSELWLWIVKQHWRSTFNRIWRFCDPIWPICNQIWPVCDLVWSICNPIWPFFDPIRPFCDPIRPFCDPTRPFCDRIWPICDPMWPCLGPIWLFLGLYSWSGLIWILKLKFTWISIHCGRLAMQAFNELRAGHSSEEPLCWRWEFN